MAVNFPDSPTNGQTVTFGSTTYTYNSTKGIWSSSGTSASVDNYLEVSNSTVFVTKADAVASNNAIKVLIDDRLQVANLQPKLDAYLQVANLQPQLDKYLQVGNAVSLTAFDVITTAPSGNGSLIYTSANGSFTFTPANATQGGVGGGGSGNTNLTVSDSAPGSPADGDLWFDSEDLIMYVYYDDGSSSQWVKTSPSSSTDVSGYLQVANLQPQLDKYLQVANSTSFATTSSFDVLTSTPSGNGSLVYNSSNGSFTFTPANATQGGGGGGGASVTSSDTAPSSPSAGDLWFHTTQLKLYVYYSDGSSNQWIQTNSGVGNRVDEFIKAYRYQGTLAINTGDTRLYLQDSYILKGIHAYVDTAPTGLSVITDVKKNGSSLQTITVAAGATSASNTSLSHTFVSGDYLTVDITQVGSSTAGENLYMVFTFN